MQTRRRTHLRAWRTHRGFTQETFAEAIGLERSYYSRIETGKRPYDQDILERAAQVLECSTADLLTRDPEDAPTLWSIYAQMNADQKAQLAGFAQILVSGLGAAHAASPVTAVHEPGRDFLGAPSKKQ